MIDFATTALNRDILRLQGDDTISFLQGLLTCNLDSLSDGGVLHGALLTPQGKIIDTLFLSRKDDVIFMDVTQGRGEGIRKKLSLYRLRAKVDIDDVTHEFQIGVSPANGSVPSPCLINGSNARHAQLGRRWLVEGQTEPYNERQYLDTLIAYGIPSFGMAYGEAEAFPLDVNLDALHGIDHKKGCFVGQEVASRMFRKGSIRKRTWIVKGPGLAKGQTLRRKDSTVGEVTSVAGDVGTALVRLDRLDGDHGPLQVISNVDDILTIQRPDYLK